MEQTLRLFVDFIDRMSKWSALTLRWLTVCIVAVVVIEVTMRFVFRNPTYWAYETLIMMGGTVFIVGWAYVHSIGRHIRVDVLYLRLSPRSRALIDSLCTVFVLLPLIGSLTVTAFHWFLRSVELNERFPYTTWFPPMAPFRMVVVIGLVMFMLQAVAQCIRDVYYIKEGRPL